MPGHPSSHRHSEEVFEEDDDLLHSDSLSSPVFSPSLQQLQPSDRHSSNGSSGKGSYRRDSASKQHLVFVPAPARGSPPSSLSSSPTTAAAAAARHRRSMQPLQPSQQQQPRRPETLRLRSTTNENVFSAYAGAPKQLLSLSPSFHSKTPPRRRLSTTGTHSLCAKETLALRSSPLLVKPIDKWCVYCYQVVCSLYEVRGLAPPRVDEGGEWTGHAMMRGTNYECHRLVDLYRNPQCA
ncbi:hypothetical protein PRIPAC_84148 [Pristionchus pacificus]|uniref:Uncharacterized protein n=1 Tax=Pristionchus pacificus TaxID=54126 RepID=A0A2A6BTX6_PRIPA|nr:hypothetical protein PRIPAC_84148 [Pristionchus pacificus]|eukprot:PDM69432.1 hypothetical protein PRIPAC_44528 [Pristionchus pacificus]